jgi:hypothetical protein
MAGLAAGFGAVEFVLFAVRLGFFSLGLHKHRLAGHAGTAKHPTTQPAADAATASPAVQSETSPAVPEKQQQAHGLKPTVEEEHTEVLGKESKPVV